jgi:DNA-nicking Smr family endonuclease
MAWSLAEGGEPLKFLRPGHSPDLLKKLRRGQWRVEDELDLHGLNRAQAAGALNDVLDETRARCGRIVHG